ncbi:titin-like [Helicoverpa zea]|uniref:titin-like n=1 Tax=Helicoverpa zea TaxID=7113 RepID=UPI001F56A021|nr:titin-like [Helicoverpa zea]
MAVTKCSYRLGTSTFLFVLVGNFIFGTAISGTIDYEPKSIQITVNENFNTQPGHGTQENGHFLHQGANFYFKPQLNIRPNFIPSHIEALISLLKNQPCSKDKLIEILKPFINAPSQNKPGLEVIPDAPLLPPLALADIPSAVGDEEDKLDQQVILEEPTVPEISSKPDITVINSNPRPITAEFSDIPEAPVLPPMVFNNLPAAIGEEIKLEEQLISGKPGSVFLEPKPINAELPLMPEAPVLPPLVLDKIPLTFEEEAKLENQQISEEDNKGYSTISVQPLLPEPKPVTPEFSVVPEAPELPPLVLTNVDSAFGEEIKLEEQLLSERPTGMFPEIPEISAKPEITLMNTEPKPVAADFSAIPEAPVLPPLAFDKIPVFTTEEQLISEEPNGVYPTISVLPSQPKPVVIQTKPFSPEFTIIPEAPVLPPLVITNIPSTVSEESKWEEQVFSQEPTGVFPQIPEILAKPEITVINTEPRPVTAEFSDIPEAPVLPPLAFDKISFGSTVEQKLDEQSMQGEPTGMYPTLPETHIRPEIFDTESKPINQELPIIPEAPVLPPLELNSIPSAIGEEIKMEKQVISGLPSGAYPSIPEIIAKPEITVINTEPRPVTAEFSDIPEAPVLPPLAFDKISFGNTVEQKLEEQSMQGEPTGMYPTLPEMIIKPEVAVFDTESKPIKQELPIIPEAPILPPLELNNIPSAIGEEIKLEEQLILGEPASVYPSIPEILAKPEITVINTENKKIFPELSIIPEAPVLPPLVLADIPSAFAEEIKSDKQLISQGPTYMSPEIPELLAQPEITAVNTESKPITAEFAGIPEAPVLPPLELNNIPSVIGGEIKMEEQVISGQPSGAYPSLPGILTKPEITVINTENKPIFSELPVILEAPVLPPLGLAHIPSAFEKEIKSDEQFISQGPTYMSPEIPELLAQPEITIINTESKPITAEFSGIPEGPVLPPLAFDKISFGNTVEQKLEEQSMQREPSGVYPTLPGMLIKPEITVFDTESKQINQEFPVIPEAPVLPPLVLNNIPSAIGEEIKLEEQVIPAVSADDHPTIPEVPSVPEPIATDSEPKPLISELPILPQAPVLPPLSFNNIPAVIGEEIKLDEQLITEVPTDEHPTNPEVSVVSEPITIDNEPKPLISELSIIPEAPVLASLEQEEKKFDDALTLGEYTDMSSNPEVLVNNEELVESPDAIMIPGPSSFLWNNGQSDLRSVDLEETIKFEKSIQEMKYSAPEETERVRLESAPLVLEKLKKVYSIKTPQFSDSFVLKEVSRPNLYNLGRDIVVKKTPISEIILKPGSRQGLFSFAPFISPFSQRLQKKKVIIPKSASLQHFLVKKHPFSLPIVPSPKLKLQANRLPFDKKNQFLFSTSCAQNIVKERIAPNMFINKLRKYFNFK